MGNVLVIAQIIDGDLDDLVEDAVVDQDRPQQRFLRLDALRRQVAFDRVFGALHGGIVRLYRTLWAKKYQDAAIRTASQLMRVWVSLRTNPMSCSRMIMACLDTLVNPPASITVAAMRGQVPMHGSKHSGPQ